MFYKYTLKMNETNMNTKNCHLVEEMKHDSSCTLARETLEKPVFF